MKIGEVFKHYVNLKEHLALEASTPPDMPEMENIVCLLREIIPIVGVYLFQLLFFLKGKFQLLEVTPKKAKYKDAN